MKRRTLIIMGTGAAIGAVAVRIMPVGEFSIPILPIQSHRVLISSIGYGGGIVPPPALGS
ncbi:MULTISPECIES: hypothetical protein [unclassified Microcystis]|uniref:hypothetical protein n=1 Tax=unclassified Microcystis TaxID=2643300 RepID=UPI0025845F6D|nr:MULTISPECIES: hypothetical protein [unclassified Microcystis]